MLSCAESRLKESPSFPALTLEQVFGALAFYMANPSAVDRSLRQGKVEINKLRAEARRKNPGLYAKLAEARQNPHNPV